MNTKQWDKDIEKTARKPTIPELRDLVIFESEAGSIRHRTVSELLKDLEK